MMLDATKSAGHFRLWMLNGGGETLRSYGQFQMNFDPPSNHFHFYRNTRIFYETDDFVFVHGGLEPDRGIREQLDTDDENQLYDMMWERGHLKADTSHWEKTVVFGHTPVPEIHQAPKQLGIDTGCVYKKLPRLGVLTAALLPDMTFIQQPCLDNPQPY
jgi:serine/threonine protein phosphatase 1